jgi:hypothetical protein
MVELLTALGNFLIALGITVLLVRIGGYFESM